MKKEINTGIGTRLRIARNFDGLDIKKLEEETGITEKEIESFEQEASYPAFEYLEALAGSGINLNYIFLGNSPIKANKVQVDQLEKFYRDQLEILFNSQVQHFSTMVLNENEKDALVGIASFLGKEIKW